MAGIYVTIIEDSTLLKESNAKCSLIGCKNNKNVVQKRVKKAIGDKDNIDINKTYIIPLCNEHKNELNGGIYVDSETTFLEI